MPSIRAALSAGPVRGADSMYTGACPAGQAPVYRLWNERADSNHRYTTDPGIRAAMLAKGYKAEGYGNDGVPMCSTAAVLVDTLTRAAINAQWATRRALTKSADLRPRVSCHERQCLIHPWSVGFAARVAAGEMCSLGHLEILCFAAMFANGLHESSRLRDQVREVARAMGNQKRR